MAFLGGLGALAGLAQGYAQQQQRQQQQQTEALRQRQALMQLQERQRQRQQQQNVAPILRGLALGGSLDLSRLGVLPQGTGAGGGMPGGGMPTSPPGGLSPTGGGSPPLSQVIAQGGVQPIVNRMIRGEGSSPAGVQNNPGNIKYAGLTGQTDSGVRATDGGDFASYASPQAGRAGIAGIAENAAAGKSKSYGSAPTLDSFIKTYTGKSGSSAGGQAAPPAPEGVNAPAVPPPPGGFDIATLAHAIEKTNPGIDDETFVAALDSASALMSRGTQQQWKQYTDQRNFQEKQQEFGIRNQEVQAQRDQTNEFARARLAQGAARVDQGQQKLDTANQKQKATELPDDVANMLAEQGASGDQSWKQNLGRGVQGAANIVKVQGMINQILKSRGQTGADLATKEAEFGGLKAGERTLSQRTANIGMRINEAQQFAPLALAASANVDRSQFPSLNRLIEAGMQGIGDENVVRLGVATNSLLNAYAAAVTPTGTPTEGAQTRARELLNMAWSNGQFSTAIDQLMKEMKAAQTSPGVVREEFRKGTDPGQSANPGATGGPPTITSKEQYDALPKGSPFMWNGQSLTKQ